MLVSRHGFSRQHEIVLAGDDLAVYLISSQGQLQPQRPEPKGTTTMDQETEDAAQGQVEVEARKQRCELELQIQPLKKQVPKHQEDLQ